KPSPNTVHLIPRFVVWLVATITVHRQHVRITGQHRTPSRFWPVHQVPAWIDAGRHRTRRGLSMPVGRGGRAVRPRLEPVLVQFDPDPRRIGMREVVVDRDGLEPGELRGAEVAGGVPGVADT